MNGIITLKPGHGVPSKFSGHMASPKKRKSPKKRQTVTTPVQDEPTTADSIAEPVEIVREPTIEEKLIEAQAENAKPKEKMKINALDSQLQDLRLKSERLAKANKSLMAELDSE